MDIIQVNDNIIIKSFRFIKSKFSGNSAEPIQLGPFGDDSVPVKGMKGIKTGTSTSSVHVILGYFNKNVKAKEGEKRLFSVKSDGSEGFYIYFKNDGTFELGGENDFLVRYNALKAGFDQLKTDFNNLVAAYNLHIHSVSGSTTQAPIPQGLDSEADISNSKIEQIKTL